MKYVFTFKEKLMNAINSTFIFNNRENLLKKLKIRLSNSDIRGALSDIREYIQNFPTEKDILLSLYATMLNDIGSTSAAKSIAKLYADVNDKTCKFAKNYFNLDPVVNTSWMLGRIGEMADQTASIHHLLTLKHIKKKPILPILQTNTLSNSAFLPYLEDVFHVLNGGRKHFTIHNMQISPRLIQHSLNIQMMYMDTTLMRHQECIRF